MGQKRLHLIVRGRVQGVYYRASAQREAKRLGLTKDEVTNAVSARWAELFTERGDE